MRTTRFIAGAVTAGLLGFTPIAIAAPSQAAVTLATTTVATPSATQLEYGEDLYVSVDVDSTDGSIPDGTSTLYAMEAGSTAWVPVSTGTASYSTFYDVKPAANTAYKVVYTGYTDTDQGQFGKNYTASESAPFTVSVARKITYPASGFVLKGKVTPEYGKKKIVIQVSKKQNKGFKKYKTIKTKANGKYKVALPKRGGTWYWSFTVKADSRFAANGFVWKTTVF